MKFMMMMMMRVRMMMIRRIGNNDVSMGKECATNANDDQLNG